MRRIALLLYALFCSALLFGQNFSYYNGKKIIQGKIIFKYSPAKLKSAPGDAQPKVPQAFSYLVSIGATEPQRKFANPVMPENCPACVDISSIYECYYEGEIPLEIVIAKLNLLEGVEYAEPAYVSELLFEPNDPEFGKGNLWNLNTCKVLDAWDVEPGNSNVVVAIVDGGIDIIQKDLINKIAYNTADPIDGIDNDGDGYVDNYRGWDMADKDNNPSSSATEHGTYVAGISNAEVNNEFGIAGVGGNTRFLPIKVCPNGSSSVTAGYEGIVYAANNGCKVINCSWGDPSGSLYGQDIVNYATINCDALVVAAAGNSASKELYYPASYNNVLSVGGTSYGDNVWAETSTKGTHYNRFVDICAPAKGFYSIANNDKTIAMSGGGTSFAAPMVSGAAALVRSKYPEYSAIQVGELLRVSADTIYHLNEEKYAYMLGNGRLNVYNALTNTKLPSIRVVNCDFPKRHLYDRDIVEVTVTFKNYLNEAKNVIITAECESFLRLEQTEKRFAHVKAGEEFSWTIAMYAPVEPNDNITTYLKFTYADDKDYKSFEFVPILLNPGYYDFELGDIRSTATSDGTIAIYSIVADQNGFDYKGMGNAIHQGGLVVAEHQWLIRSSSYWRRDFSSLQSPLEEKTDSCDLLLKSAFEVENLLINQYIYGWEDTSALVYEYRFENDRDTVMYDVRVGAYFDWAVLNSSYDKIKYIDSLELSIVFSVDPRTYYIGFMPLDKHPHGLYAFDDMHDVVYPKDGFTSNEMWHMLSNQQTSVGMESTFGAEVSSLHYTLLDSIALDTVITVRYAMLAADTESDLIQQAASFKNKYAPNDPEEVVVIDPNPSAIAEAEPGSVKLGKDEQGFFLNFSSGEGPAHIRICTATGQSLSSESIPSEIGVYRLRNLPAGVNLVTVSVGKKNQTFVVACE